jgi:hypothetical protein
MKKMGMNPNDLEMMQQGMGGEEQMPPADSMMEGGEMPPEEMMGTEEEQMGMPEEQMGEEGQDMDGDGLPDDAADHMNEDYSQFDELDDEEMMGEEYELDPLEVLPETIMEYMDYYKGITKDNTLNKTVQSKILLDGAQALSYLIPMLPSSQDATAQADMQMKQMDMQIKQAEFQMKQEEQEAALQMKREEFELQMQMKQAEMQHKQAEMQMDMQHKAQQQQQEIAVTEMKNKQDIVHKEKDQQIKAQQAKQAAQSKPTSNSGSKDNK